MIQRNSNATLRLDRADGGWLQYAVSGKGDPVVFIHGFGLDFEYVGSAVDGILARGTGHSLRLARLWRLEPARRHLIPMWTTCWH